MTSQLRELTRELARPKAARLPPIWRSTGCRPASGIFNAGDLCSAASIASFRYRYASSSIVTPNDAAYCFSPLVDVLGDSHGHFLRHFRCPPHNPSVCHAYKGMDLNTIALRP